jgi:NAD(P)-dependent dehydrogenase (short-subunit alcohol dehydrogenase family)
MDTEKKEKMLSNTAASLPLQRVGEPSDMGSAIHYLASAPFVTGVVLDVDGGHGVRQYADAATDPMRHGS